MLDLNRDRDHGPRRRPAKERRPSDLRRMEDLASHLPPPGPPPKRASPPRAPSHVHWEKGEGSPAPPFGNGWAAAPAQHGRRSVVNNKSPARRASVGGTDAGGGSGASPGLSTYPPPRQPGNSQAPSHTASPVLQFNPPDSQAPSRIAHASPQYSAHGDDAAGFHSFAGGGIAIGGPTPSADRPRSFLAELLATRDALAHEAQRRREVAGAPPAQWSSSSAQHLHHHHHHHHPDWSHHHNGSSASEFNGGQQQQHQNQDDDDGAGPLDFDSFSLGPNRRLERLETPADIRVARRRRVDAAGSSAWAAPSQVPEHVPGRSLYKPFNPTAAARGRGDQPAGEASSYLEGAIGGGYGATRRHQLDELPGVAEKIGSAVARDEVDRLLHKFATVSPRGQPNTHYDAHNSHATGGHGGGASPQYGRRRQGDAAASSSTVSVINDSDGTSASLKPYVRPSRRPPPPAYGSAPPGSPPSILDVSSVILHPAASPPASGRRGKQPHQAASKEAPSAKEQHQGPATPPPVSSTPAPVNNADDAALFADDEPAGDAAVIKEAPGRHDTEEGSAALEGASAPTPPGDDVNADPTDNSDTAVEAGADATQPEGTDAVPTPTGSSGEDGRAETRAERPGADDMEAAGDRTAPE